MREPFNDARDAVIAKFEELGKAQAGQLQVHMGVRLAELIHAYCQASKSTSNTLTLPRKAA